MKLFVDWVSLLLLNAMAGYFLLAYYVYAGLDDPEQTKWAAPFVMVGVLAAIFGGIMAVTWPLPGAYGSAYGEMSVLLGFVFAGAGVAMAKGWNLRVVAWYAFFPGVAAVIIGVSLIALRLTLAPVLSGTGFILSGLAGIFAGPTLTWLKSDRPFRILAALVLAVTGLIWAATVYPAYWMHMKMFARWQP
jgi:putative membrane protein